MHDVPGMGYAYFIRSGPGGDAMAEAPEPESAAGENHPPLLTFRVNLISEGNLADENRTGQRVQL